MRTVGKLAATFGVVASIATGSVIPASAFEVYIGPRHHHYYVTTIAVAGTVADRVGPFRVAYVNPIGMVRGTSMEGGRATTDFNIMRRPLRRPSLFGFVPQQLGSPPILFGPSRFTAGALG
jgi:hypothetical protein